MTEETKHIYLIKFWGSNYDKYFPDYDEKRSVPPDLYGEHYGWGKRIVNMDKINYIFILEDVKTEKEEKRLKSYDALRGGSNGSNDGSTIIVNERILECFSHLIDKDIQMLPSEIYTARGRLEGYYLIDVVCEVQGLDKVHSTYGGWLDDKLVPKNEDFMEGHEIAREVESGPDIYLIPSLREKLLKIRRGKELPGIWIGTAKEK